MLFLAPGQVMGSEDDGQLHQPEGWVVAFHPEFLRGTPLAHIMKDYSYFSYNANEALHLSKQERRTVIECMEKIRIELQYPIDKHSRSLIVDNIKLLRSAVVGVQDYCDDSQDFCWLYIEGSMIDYTVNSQTHTVIEGKRKKTTFVEYWKLQRIGDTFYLDDVRQKEDVNPEDFTDWRE